MPDLKVSITRLFCRCQSEQEACVCARCGRTNHQWVEMPQVESCDFEFRGSNKDGKMVYEETVRHQHVCLRCGEKSIKTTRKHVYH